MKGTVYRLLSNSNFPPSQLSFFLTLLTLLSLLVPHPLPPPSPLLLTVVVVPSPTASLLSEYSLRDSKKLRKKHPLRKPLNHPHRYAKNA